MLENLKVNNSIERSSYLTILWHAAQQSRLIQIIRFATQWLLSNLYYAEMLQL